MKVKLITHPFFSWLFYKTGFKGWTSLWDVVYIRDDSVANTTLLRHEEMHLKQMERMGKARFMWVYCTQFLRYGYRNHPLEIEAREYAQRGL